MPGACSRGLLSYAALVAPEIADDIAAVDRRHAPRLQLEMRALRADRPAWAPAISPSAWRRRSCRCRRCSPRRPRPAASIASATATLEQLGVRRRLSSDRAPAGRAAAGRHQARRQAAGRERLGQPLGYRRRRRLPRVPQQDEQHRSRQLRSCCSQSLDLVAKRKLKALVIYNEGENFSVGLNLGLALFAANIALWPMIEDMVASGPEDLQGDQIRGLPRGRRARRAWRWAAAARSCCIARPSSPMPRAISAWSRSASGWSPAGAAARSCWRAARPIPRGRRAHAAGGRDLRDHLHRQGRPLGRRGEASWASSAPATASS